MTGFALRETRGTPSSPISYACSATPCRHGESGADPDHGHRRGGLGGLQEGERSQADPACGHRERGEGAEMRPAGKRVQDSGMPGMRQLRHHPLHVQVAVLSLLREEVPRQDIRIGPGEALRRPAPAVRLLRSGGAPALVPEIPGQAGRAVRISGGDVRRDPVRKRSPGTEERRTEARVHIVPPHVRKRPEMASASPCAGRGELFRERREAAPYLLLPLRGDAEEIQVRAPLPKGRMAQGERAAREARLPAGGPPYEEKVHERLLRVRPEKGESTASTRRRGP